MRKISFYMILLVFSVLILAGISMVKSSEKKIEKKTSSKNTETSSTLVTVNSVKTLPVENASDLCISSDGKYVYFIDKWGNIKKVEVATGKISSIISDASEDNSFDRTTLKLSPNNRYLSFLEMNWNYQLYIIDLQENETDLITSKNYEVSNYAWSNDSEYIYLHYLKGEDHGAYLYSLSDETLTLKAKDIYGFGDISPDNSYAVALIIDKFVFYNLINWDEHSRVQVDKEDIFVPRSRVIWFQDYIFYCNRAYNMTNDTFYDFLPSEIVKENSLIGPYDVSFSSDGTKVAFLVKDYSSEDDEHRSKLKVAEIIWNE